MSHPQIILASTSSYRAGMLARLGLPFTQVAPDTDETPRPDETAGAVAARLAEGKARQVAVKHPGCYIIGGDQVAECNEALLGKPGTLENAREQLRLLSGNTVRFHSALCVIGPDGEIHAGIDVTEVRFRQLQDEEIRHYLEREPALDCAGSFKSEGLGISLVSRIRSDDPTGLIGLPLVLLCELLRKAGLSI